MVLDWLERLQRAEHRKLIKQTIEACEFVESLDGGVFTDKIAFVDLCRKICGRAQREIECNGILGQDEVSRLQDINIKLRRVYDALNPANAPDFDMIFTGKEHYESGLEVERIS